MNKRLKQFRLIDCDNKYRCYFCYTILGVHDCCSFCFSGETIKNKKVKLFAEQFMKPIK